MPVGTSSTINGGNSGYKTYDGAEGHEGSASASAPLTFVANGDSYTGTANFLQVSTDDVELTTASYAPAPASGGGGGGPEPSTWALMIVGIGMAGVALRRDQPQATASIG